MIDTIEKVFERERQLFRRIQNRELQPALQLRRNFSNDCSMSLKNFLRDRWERIEDLNTLLLAFVFELVEAVDGARNLLRRDAQIGCADKSILLEP